MAVNRTIFEDGVVPLAVVSGAAGGAIGKTVPLLAQAQPEMAQPGLTNVPAPTRGMA